MGLPAPIVFGAEPGPLTSTLHIVRIACGLPGTDETLPARDGRKRARVLGPLRAGVFVRCDHHRERRRGRGLAGSITLGNFLRGERAEANADRREAAVLALTDGDDPALVTVL